jgi:hypothetical protein
MSPGAVRPISAQRMKYLYGVKALRHFRKVHSARPIKIAIVRPRLMVVKDFRTLT